MSLIERISPFLSPSTRCYSGFYQVSGNGTSLSSNPIFEASSSEARDLNNDNVNNNDRDFNREINYYRSRRKSMSSSTSSSPILKHDTFLLKYFKESSNESNKINTVNKLSNHFPIISKLKTDDFYKSYICHIEIKEIREQDQIDSKRKKSAHVLKKHDYIQQHQQQNLNSIIKSPRQIIEDNNHSTNSLNFGQKTSRVKINVPSTKTSSFQKIKQPTKDTNSIQVEKLPVDFVDCSIDDLITLISRMLRSLILLNDSNVPKTASNPPSEESESPKSSLLTRYHSRTPPSISIPTYLARLTKFNNFTNATLLTTIYYIDLLSHHYQPFFTLNSWTVHRFLLVGTMLSQKLMEDFFYTNDHYAKVGGVAISELNCLELDFLTRVDWKCIPAKQMENGKTSIKYAKEVLDLYYMQLIQLMGHNVTNGDGKYFEAEKTQQGNPPKSPTQLEKVLQHIHQEDRLLDEIIVDDYQEVGEEEDEGEGDEEEEGEVDDDDEYDSDEYIEYEDSPQRFSPEITSSNRNASMSIANNKFDSFGYSIDGSSSPHLKRRYSIQSEE